MSVKSELEKTASYLRGARKAILERGGEISLTAGLEDLPNAIFNIPADASLAHYTDGDIAYRKSVPVGAEKYALLKSIGGMTYKSNNLLPYPYIDTTKTEGGVTYTDNGDGTITVSGTATGYGAFRLGTVEIKSGVTYCFSGTSNSTNIIMVVQMINKNGEVIEELTTSPAYNKYSIVCGSNTHPDAQKATVYLKRSANVVTSGIVKPMLNYGTTALPNERYYEGLRDSKVTEIVSCGANLFDDNALIDFGFTKVAEHEYFLTKIWEILDKGAIFTNTSRASGSFTISAKLLYKNVGTTSSGLFVAATYTDGTVQELHPLNGRQGEYFDYIVSTKADKVLDYIKLTFGSSGVDTTIKNMQIARGNVTEFKPYRDEPIATKPIPKALQDIDGYGWGVSKDCYNYIDYENKQFVKRVGCLDMGTLAWNKMGSYRAWEANVSNFNVSFASGYYETFRCLHPLYVGASLSETVWNTTENTVATSDGYDGFLFCCNYESTPPTGILYYELAEPIITDISDILTNDNFIEVESGGSLEFVNEYKYAVPSTVKYTIKVGN